jgi:hypothetical protein
VRNIFWKLFPPFEVKVTVEEIRAFLGSDAWASRSIIEQAAIEYAKDAEKTVYFIRIDRMKPDHLALFLILNVLGIRLASGQYHIHRGVLGIIGKDMLSMWTAAVREMQERGYYDDQKAKEDMQWVQKQIKNGWLTTPNKSAQSDALTRASGFNRS